MWKPLTWKQCRLMALLCGLLVLTELWVVSLFDPKYESGAIMCVIFLMILPAVGALIAFSVMAYSRWKEEEGGQTETGPSYITLDERGEFTVKSTRELTEQRVEMKITTVEEAQETLEKIEDLYHRQGVISREDYQRVKGQLLEFIQEESEPS